MRLTHVGRTLAVLAFVLTGFTLPDPGAASTKTLRSHDQIRIVRTINRYLARFPMRHSGWALLAAGCRHGIDPRLLVGIAGAETTFGAGYHPSLNVWGNGPGAYMGPTWQAAAEEEASNLDRWYFRSGLDSPWRIAFKYLGHSDYAGWADKVARIIWDLGGQPAELRVRCRRW